MLRGDAEHFGSVSTHANRQHHTQNPCVLRLGLNADAVRTLHITTHDGPHHAASKDKTCDITNEGVAAIHIAMQELERFGHLVIDFQHRGDPEQHEEPEIHHRVHEPGGRVAQQRAHVDTGAEIFKASLYIFRCCSTVVWRPALPVADAISKAQ